MLPRSQTNDDPTIHIRNNVLLQVIDAMKLVVDNFVRDLVRVALNESNVDNKRIDRVEVLRALERLGASEELAEVRSVEQASIDEVSHSSR